MKSKISGNFFCEVILKINLFDFSKSNFNHSKYDTKTLFCFQIKLSIILLFLSIFAFQFQRSKLKLPAIELIQTINNGQFQFYFN